MKPYRFNGSALQNVGPSAFQSHWEGRIVGRDLNDPEILTPELFMSLRGTVRVGDEVVICGYASDAYDRLTQFVRVRVLASDKDGVRIVKDGDVVEIPFVEGEKEPAAPIEKAWVKRAFGGVFNVVDAKEDVLESFKTNQEAKEYVTRVNAGGM